ncbi:MAG: hypothetical protein AAGA77_25735 [Bacteroidota bacterium]
MGIKAKDKIQFGCLKSLLEDYMTTSIYINGVDLKEKIEKIEVRQCAKRGFKVCNGCYEGISFFIAFHYQNHFLCRTLKDYIYDGQHFALYDYKFSGIPGDHSLTCKISLVGDEIIWHDFKNFSKIIPFELDYEGLEFRFCIDQYREAIDEIRSNKEENMFA